MLYILHHVIQTLKRYQEEGGNVDVKRENCLLKNKIEINIFRYINLSYFIN